MSALSIPPSRRTSISVHLESVHNYANILNPIAVIGAEQYSVVAIYTETEESRLDPDMMETAEVQLQTDFYEEEIVAASGDGRVEANGFGSEDPGETVGVAKALETLTKAFALRKESISQEAQTGKVDDGSENRLEQEDETGQRTETKAETVSGKVMEDSQEGETEDMTESGATLEDKHVPCSVQEETLPETQQSLCSGNVRRSTRLQMKTSPSRPEMSSNESSSAETAKEPEMYKPSILSYTNY